MGRAAAALDELLSNAISGVEGTTDKRLAGNIPNEFRGGGSETVEWCGTISTCFSGTVTTSENLVSCMGASESVGNDMTGLVGYAGLGL